MCVCLGWGGGTCEDASHTVRCEIRRKLHIVVFCLDDLAALSHKVVGLFYGEGGNHV